MKTPLLIKAIKAILIPFLIDLLTGTIFTELLPVLQPDPKAVDPQLAAIGLTPEQIEYSKQIITTAQVSPVVKWLRTKINRI